MTEAPELMLNLSAWIERRKQDVGPYADHIIHSVSKYEAEIERLRAVAADLPAAVTVKPLECENCRQPATRLCQMTTHECDPMPICEQCAAQHDATAAEINEHEMREFGGAYGMVTYHYLPLPEATQPDPDRVLARHQPCGCIICQCEDEEQCHGCGAKTCGTHPVGDIPDPVFADQREAALRDMAEFDGKLLTQPDTVKDAAQWRPIETAPRVLNGIGVSDRILAFVPPYGATTAHWDGRRWSCHSVLSYDAQPTHWMPLPAPPRALAEQETGQ